MLFVYVGTVVAKGKAEAGEVEAERVVEIAREVRGGL